MEYSNLIYFAYLNAIGGVETWLYNLSCIYKERDIAIVYRGGDAKQVARLQENVKLIKWDGKRKFSCDNLFVCFNTEILPYVSFKKSYLVLHGDYEDMVKRGQLHKVNLPIHELIDEYIGVSQTVCDAWERLTGIKAMLCYNPVLPVSDRKRIRLCSAQRMSAEKGANRISRLAYAMDEYCRRTGREFVWDIYTNNRNTFHAPNVCFKEQTLDVCNLYRDYDWFVALSDNEGYCYSVVENLIRGIPCIVTDLPVFRELGLDDSNSIRFDFEMTGIDDAIEKIFETRLNFVYFPPKDKWDKLFTNKKAKYRKGDNMLHKVVALDTYEKLKVNDKALGKIVPEGFEFEVEDDRLDVLLGNNPYKTAFVKVVEEKPEEEVKPKKTKKRKTE